MIMKQYLPATLAFGLLALFLWSGIETRNLKTQYSLDQFYPTEHPLLQGHEEITKRFRLQKQSPYLHVIELPRGLWTEKKNIQLLKQLTRKIEEREDVKSVLSLTHVEGATETKSALSIGTIFDHTPSSQWKEKILSHPLLYPLLISKDLKATLFMVEPKTKDKSKLEALEKDVQLLLTKTFPNARIHSAGVPLLQTRLSNLIQSELLLFLLGTSLVFCLVFLLIFSHWSAILCAFLSLFGANLFTLGLMSLFNIPMNAILVTLPVIVSVSIMSLLVHTLHLWAKHRKEGSFIERSKLVQITLLEIWLPNTLGIATTALGFLALAPSAIPLISEYGFTVSIILVFVAILNQVMMMVFLPWVDPSMRGWFDRPAKWALVGINKPFHFLIPMLMLFLLSSYLAPKLNFSAKLFDDLPKSDLARASTEWIDQSFGGTLGFDLLAHSEKEGYWKDPQNLDRLKTATKILRDIDGVGMALSVPDFLPNGPMGTSAQIAETFFLFSMSHKNPLNNFMTDDGKSLRLSLRFKDIPADKLSAAKALVLHHLSDAFPEISLSQGGISSYAHTINEAVSRNLIFDFWHPLLAIGIFLIFMFKSFKWAILSCLPNFIPPAALITTLALTGVAVKPGIALIFSIALGFAFNNTLYVLTRLKAMNGQTDSLKSALLQEGHPCLFESLIMFAGFSLFLFSDFTMNQTFGGFMLLSILSGFVADLFCLPALLKVFPFLYQKQVERSPSLAGLAILIGLSAVGSAIAGESAKDILKKSQALLDAKDDQAKVEMKIIEENGEIKNRTINLQTLRANGFSVMARIESPADIKNMAFLGNVDTDGNEMQWIFLPSSGQVRRLIVGESKAGLLGSEISPEDLNSEAIKSSVVKIQKSDKDYHWIELTPMKGKSDYSKVITRISKVDFLPQETQYYLQNKLKKTVQFKDYKKIGPVWRAHNLVVKNHFNKRGTEILLTEVKVNSGLGSDDFSQSSLKEN
jgi:predicted RND superfamily exporter protein/outer membrane lipoprotein-sorting protein